MITKNLSMFLHFQVESVDAYKPGIQNIGSGKELPMKKFRNSVPLVRYMKQIKEADTMNLMNDIPQPKQKDDNSDDADKFYPHWKPSIDLNLVYREEAFLMNEPVGPEVRRFLQIDRKRGTYNPIVHPSEFWCLKKYMIPLNESLFGTELNLTLNF